MFANTWCFQTVGSFCAANSEVPPLKYRPGDGRYVLVLVEFLRPSSQWRTQELCSVGGGGGFNKFS